MKLLKIKKIISLLTVTVLLTACASKNTNQTTNTNQPVNDNQRAVIGATLGAILGIVIGNNIKSKNKKRNKVVAGIIGATIGGAIGHNMDKQAKEIADTLNTDVNNNPNAVLNPNNDLIVSNTDSYVKIMFRDSMMFETNLATPTLSAQNQISKINSVLAKYPNTLVQVVGHTDSRGTHAYNKSLSEQRATNVGNIIHASGVNNQIFSRGCSYDKPVALNNNATNMGLNRRVEIFLYPNQESVIDVCS